MDTGTRAAILVGALSVVPMVSGGGAGQPHSPNTQAESPQSTAAVPSHALSGVVKSIDATRLVITRAGKNRGEMTFVLSPATEREGPISVGATVQVRFRTEGRTQVATAVLATPPKPREKGKAP